MKTKIKLMALVAGLLSILPTTSAWANTDVFYYAKATAEVSSTGGGKVYASSTSVDSPDSQCTGTTSTSGVGKSAANKQSVTLYRYAKANDGFEFKGWSTADNADISTISDTSTSVTVVPSATSEGNADSYTYYAYFAKLKLAAFGITFETSDAGTYTVGGGAPANMTGLTEATSVVLASSDPNFLNWKVNDAVVNDNPYAATCIADTTISAEFLTADQVAEATTFDELTAALANDGKKKITIPAGASCAIPAGTTFTVSNGKKLVVDGTLMVIGTIANNGTIAGSGIIAYNAKTITQEAKVNVPYPAGTDGPAGTASGLVACDENNKAKEVGTAGKYLNTSTSNGATELTGLSLTKKYFVTVVNKASGETFTSSLLDTKPVAIVCTVARDKALNWISGMDGTTSSYNSVKAALDKAKTSSVSGVANYSDSHNRMAVLMENAGTVAYDGGGSSVTFGTIVDLAGKSLTVSASNKTQYNYHAIVRAFNGSISLSQKVMSTKFFLYNCTGSLGYLSGGNQYGTAAYLYDSPNYSVTFNDLVTDSPAGSLNFCGGGPYTTTKVKFQTTPTTKFNVVYAGTFVSGMNPTSYLWDPNKVEAVQDPSTKNWIVQDKYVDPNKGQTLVNGEEHSFVEAFEIAKAGDVIKLQRDVELEEDLNVASGKDVRLDLSGFALSGDFKIVNNGELEIIDCNNGVVPSQVNVQIVNNGTLLLSNAAYNGDIMLNKGLCYFLAGSFNGDVILAADAVANEVAQVRGGTFAKSVYKQGGGEGTLLSLCKNGYTEGGKIAQIPNSYIVGPGMVKKASFSIRALLPNDEALVTRVSSYEENRNRYTKTEWINLMTVRASSSFFAAWNVDCGARVDRDVGAGDLKLGVLIVTEDIPAISVGDSASVLLPAMRDSGMASGAWGYQSILPGGENADKVEFTVQGNQVAEGTSVWMEMRLVRSLHVLTQPKDWSYSGPYVVTGSRRFVVGAEANKAMVWGEEGGATFYSTLDMAVAADATTGKTIKLCNDCDEKVTVSKVCTIDTNGFAFNGEITAGDCYAVTATDLGDGKMQYEVKLSKVTVGIPAVANTTLAVTASEGEVTDLGNGRYQVAPGATVTATYTPNEGFFGNAIVKTIASAAEGAAVTVSAEEAASVKAIVAKIGEMPYASLAEAVEAAAESGETIDVVKESTLTVVEGVELTVTSGQLVAAVPADNVLELKDGTDVTLAWPTAEGAADHIIVTGGRYSADPSAFLADGLEAKEKDGQWVVGVKVVIVIDEEQEATEENTAEKTVMTGEQTSKVDEEKVEEVIKDVVPEEKREELVDNIKTSTKVEGVKLTTVDEVVVPDETKPDEKEVVKESGVKAVVLAAKAVAQETTVAAADKTDGEKTQAEKDAAAFKAALEQKEKDVEITVKVEVKAKLVEYVPPAETAVQEAPKGTIKFELKPEAVVTVAVKDETPVQQVVPVSNDMIDQKQKIKVSMYAGFKPVQVLHRDDNGQLIEEFTGDAIGYDEATRIVSVMISHFSTVELNEAPVDPLAPSGATKVADGFYQNATTYQDATEFYITSKAGLEYFRDLVNSYDAAYATYAEGGFWTGTRKTFYGYGKENFLFKDKVIKLCADIDLGNEEWDPIGNEKKSDGTSRTEGSIFYIYGAFDGQNHTISNLKINTETLADKDGAGLFGRVAENASFRNLTICNVDIYAKSYVGVLCGNCGSGSGVIAIDNVHVAGKISVNGYGYVGGLVGHGCYSISNSSVVGNNGTGDAGKVISRYWQVGGIAGTGRSYSGVGITNCRVENIDMEVYYYEAGGIVGRAYSDVKNCVVEKVTIGAYNGSSSFDASQCGMITANAYQGGIIVTENSPKEPGQCASITDNVIVGWNIVGSIAEAGITGGTFENIPATYIASGYEKVAQGTTPETWVVQEVAVVAKIGEVTYPSLQAAIDEVGEGQTIVLLADTDEQLSGGAKKFVIDCGSGRDGTENVKQFDVENFAAQEGWMLQEFDLGDYHTYYEYIKPVCKVEVSGIFDDWVTYYETLADALSYEKHNAFETIQLVADCDEDIVIDITTYGLEDDKNPDLCNFTVEENGYNFTGSIVGVNGAKVTKNGTTWTIEPGYVAEIEGEWTTVKYLSLVSAVAAAEEGETIEVIADIADEKVTVGKSLTIAKGEGLDDRPVLHNVDIVLSDNLVSVLDGLKFTGDSVVDVSFVSGNLTMTNCYVDVVVNRKLHNLGRVAFLVSDNNTAANMSVNLVGNTFIVDSETDVYNAAVFMWTPLSGRSVIEDNVFGSSDKRYYWIAVKFMNGRDGAEVFWRRNTVYAEDGNDLDAFIYDAVNYVNNKVYIYGENNVINATHVTPPNHFYAYQANDCVRIFDSGTTINGTPMTMSEFEIYDSAICGTGCVFDGDGKLMAGSLNRALSAEESAELVASGYEAVPQGTTPETWKVQEAAPPELQGSGTAADPWQIWTLADLKTFRDNVNANGKYCNGFVSVFANIDLGGEEWTPIGTGSNGNGAFYGTFDGQEHVISNLKIDSTASNVGLFGYAGYSERGGTIKNLTIENAEVKGANDVAALAGYFHVMTLIENVHVIGTVKIQATGADAGGIVGKTSALPVIKNCSVVATPESGAYIKARTSDGSASAGGMIGFAGGEGWTCEIRDCFVANIDFTSYNRIGGIAGSLQRPSGYGSVDMYVTGCKVSNVTVTVTGPSNATLSNRHDAQAGLIVGCPAGSGSRNKHHYSDNTYSGECSVTAKSGATDIIPTQLYGLWALGYSRASDIGQTWGAEGTGDADIVPEITIGGADYRTFLKGYKVAGATGSSKDDPFVLHTDVGYTLLAQDRIYVRADGNVFYPRTDLGRAIRSVDCGDGVTLYYVAPEGGVCKIGDRIYETLADALREATASDTVVLTADATMAADAGVSPVCKIDMKGFALSVPDDPAFDGKVVDSANAAKLLGYVVEGGERTYSPAVAAEFNGSIGKETSDGVNFFNIYMRGYAATIEAQNAQTPDDGNIKISFERDGKTNVLLYTRTSFAEKYFAQVYAGWKYPMKNDGVDCSNLELVLTMKSGKVESLRASSKITYNPTAANEDTVLKKATVNFEGGEANTILASWAYNQSVETFAVNVSGGTVGKVYGNGETSVETAANQKYATGAVYVPTVGAATITVTGGEVGEIYGGGRGNTKPTMSPTDTRMKNSPWSMVTEKTEIVIAGGKVDAVFAGGRNVVYNDKVHDKVIVNEASIDISGGRIGSVSLGGNGTDLCVVETATERLTGGIYTTKPDAAYIAEGYEAASNPDEETKEAYPWKVQEKTVKTEDDKPIVVDISKAGGEPSAEAVKVPVTVTEELAKEILEVESSGELPKLQQDDIDKIVTQLETKGEDGMTGWQKYAAGFSQTDKHPLAPKGKGGEDGKLVLVTSLVAPKQLSVDTGVKVKYILKKATKVNPTTGVPDDGDFEAVQELPTPEFPVDVTELDPETYWKIDVEYTATRVVETPVEPEVVK